MLSTSRDIVFRVRVVRAELWARNLTPRVFRIRVLLLLPLLLLLRSVAPLVSRSLFFIL